MLEPIFNDINRQVNREITYMSDLEQYGVLEYWIHEPKSKKGDCEDYALTKFSRLIGKGIPRSRMGIAKVWTRINGVPEGHAILLVDNIWVLDNVTNRIRRINETDYIIAKILR